MPNFFAVNVYQINDNEELTQVERQAFAPANVKLRATPLLANSSSSVKTAAGVNLYGIVQELPRGLQTGSTNFHVVETVAQLVALAG
jgi:hypothetical protein